MSDTSSDDESEEFGEGAAAAREETSESEEQEERDEQTTDLSENFSGTEPMRKPRLEWRVLQTWDVEELGNEHCERELREIAKQLLQPFMPRGALLVKECRF